MYQGSIIIAGTHSGVGKTTISIGIMAALKARGLDVQPFKVGPDFIDPAYHCRVTGRPSRNLDGRMMGKKAVLEVYSRTLHSTEIGIIEGVMGLFDGVGRNGMEGSTAEIAKLTGVPVVLVVDAKSQAGSAAAVVKGFETLDPDVKVAGVILNRVGSDRHEALLRAAIKRSCRAKVIGVVPRDDKLDIPSRHLGLTTDIASILTDKFVKRLVETIEKSVDLDALIMLSGKAKKVPVPKPRPVVKKTARLAVAMDEAFCFYYPDNLELLEDNGVEIVPFSPLKDDGLPEGVSGIYLGGGYPEMYARGLSFNDFIMHDIRHAAVMGLPIYAECGGLMYLTRSITDLEGVPFHMAGVLPVRTRMLDRRKALGYREITIAAAGTIFPEGKTARGHEFHYSEVVDDDAGITKPYMMRRSGEAEAHPEGFLTGSVVASYVHLHFMSNRSFAKSFAHNIIKAPRFKR